MRSVAAGRAYLKKAFRKLRVPVCGRFRSNEGGVAGLRQPNDGQIYRKVGLADCGNDFSDTLPHRLCDEMLAMDQVNPILPRRLFTTC